MSSNNNYGYDNMNTGTTGTTGTTTGATGSNTGKNMGSSAGNAIKSTFTKIHGAGESLRGNVNSFLDSIVNTDSTRSQNVADRGAREFKTGVYEGTGAGVTPTDTAAEKVNRNFQGEGRPGGTL